ncbi:pyridine nucleotide-disulfide oxidoreductase, partial [Streptomyces sp. NPDC059409]
GAARPGPAPCPRPLGLHALYPGAGDTRPNGAERLLARFVDKAVETGARNPRAMEALLDVMSLERPATRLFSRDMLVPMLIGPRRPHLEGPPLTDAERKGVVP